MTLVCVSSWYFGTGSIPSISDERTVNLVGCPSELLILNKIFLTSSFNHISSSFLQTFICHVQIRSFVFQIIAHELYYIKRYKRYFLEISVL